MIGQGISEVMTFAVGVAISPLPIIAVILVLFSDRARVNAPAFLLGWVVGLTAVCTAVYLITDASDAATDSGASDSTSTVKVVLGVVLIALALRTWRHRHGAAEPKWMRGVETMPPGRALVLGLFLSAVNPKNLILTAGAAAGLGQLGVDAGAAVASIAFFVVVGSALIAGPVLYSFVGGASARTRLDELKGWFTANYATVMSVLFLVFGVLLISKGTGLLST